MKVAVTGRNFVVGDSDPVAYLRAHGFEVCLYEGPDLGVGSEETDVAAAIGDADAVIAGLEPIGKTVLERCPNLRLVSRRGIGFDAVDLDACRAHGVAVIRTTGAVEEEVAEHVLAFILHFARDIAGQNASMHRGEWVRRMTPGAKGKTLGLVGFGGIGKEVARRAVPFGMRVLYNCRHPKAEWESEYGVRYAPLDEMLAQSDYIALCVPLTEETRGFFGAEQLAQMKKGSVLINIARGQITDTLALRDALQSGQLRGAGIDVYDYEPCTDSPLLACEGAVLTPHTAPYTDICFCAVNECAAKNVVDFFAGTLEEKYRLV